MSACLDVVGGARPMSSGERASIVGGGNERRDETRRDDTVRTTSGRADERTGARVPKRKGADREVTPDGRASGESGGQDNCSAGGIIGTLSLSLWRRPASAGLLALPAERAWPPPLAPVAVSVSLI